MILSNNSFSEINSPKYQIKTPMFLLSKLISYSVILRILKYIIEFLNNLGSYIYIVFHYKDINYLSAVAGPGRSFHRKMVWQDLAYIRIEIPFPFAQ